MDKTILGIIVIILGIALMGLGTCASTNNSLAAAEEGIKSQWSQNQNVYDEFWKTVSEVAQVPEMYKDDFKEILIAAKNDTSATMLWLQERSVNFDPSIYRDLMATIEAGRRRFSESQTQLVDRKRRYATDLRSFPGSLWARSLGFPTEIHGDLAPPSDLDGDGRLTVLDYPIVTSEKTAKAFATGKDDALQIRPKS